MFPGRETESEFVDRSMTVSAAVETVQRQKFERKLMLFRVEDGHYLVFWRSIWDIEIFKSLTD
jgi:predicted transcriptional regulator YdeE